MNYLTKAQLADEFEKLANEINKKSDGRMMNVLPVIDALRERETQLRIEAKKKEASGGSR